MMQKKFLYLQSLILIAMARLARQQTGTGIYHVMLRGIKPGIDSPSEVQSLDKNQRDVVLEKLLTCGGGIRQISRMTGISFGIIQKISKRV